MKFKFVMKNRRTSVEAFGGAWKTKNRGRIKSVSIR